MSVEKLDIEQPDQLLAYLRATNRIGADETPEMKTLAGGVSNRTVLVKRASGEAWVIKQALAKLRVKVDWFSDPSRIHREALGLRWLEKLAPPGTITPLIFEDEEHHLLAMQAVPEPHENFKSMLLAGNARNLRVGLFGHLLAIIHVNASKMPDPLSRVFADRSFFESLRLEPYYLYAAAQVPEAADFLHELVTDTRARQFTLVHGDYSPKNILVPHGTNRMVLLDHEVIHWGDPAFDVGFAATHLLSKWHYHAARGAGGIAAGWFDAFWHFYWSFSTSSSSVPWVDELDRFCVRHTLACMIARVVGRSPLEYLDDAARARQRRAVLDIMRKPPTCMSALFGEFAKRMESDAGN